MYILTLTLGLVSCNGNAEKADDNSISSAPQQFKLTDTTRALSTGDYYLSTDVDYFFSGEGDGENWLDETPYLYEYSQTTLDSIVDFLNGKKDIHVSINFISDSDLTFDSCVSCAFEETIRQYLVSDGIAEDRLMGGYGEKGTADHPVVDSFDEYMLLVIEPAP